MEMACSWKKLTGVVYILCEMSSLIHSCFVGKMPSLTFSYIQPGEILVLNVNSYTGTNEVLWIKDGSRIALQNCNGKHNYSRICTTKGDPSLTIRNTTLEDSGLYSVRFKCIGFNEFHFRVVVEIAPNVYSNCSDMSINEGDSITCRCSATNGHPRAKLSWSQNTTGKGIKGREILNDTLILRSISRNDSGIYTCLARSRDLVNKTSFNLKVIWKKAVKIKFFKVLQEPGSSNGRLFIICNAEGIPELTYMISHNGRDVKIGNIYIVNPEISSLGLYECSARNTVGIDWSSLVLNASILGRPKPTSIRNGCNEMSWKIPLIVGISSFLAGILVLFLSIYFHKKFSKTDRRYENSGIALSPEDQLPRSTQGLGPYERQGLRHRNSDQYEWPDGMALEEKNESGYENQNNYQELTQYRDRDEERYQSLNPILS